MEHSKADPRRGARDLLQSFADWYGGDASLAVRQRISGRAHDEDASSSEDEDKIEKRRAKAAATTPSTEALEVVDRLTRRAALSDTLLQQLTSGSSTARPPTDDNTIQNSDDEDGSLAQAKPAQVMQSKEDTACILEADGDRKFPDFVDAMPLPTGKVKRDPMSLRDILAAHVDKHGLPDAGRPLTKASLHRFHQLMVHIRHVSTQVEKAEGYVPKCGFSTKPRGCSDQQYLQHLLSMSRSATPHTSMVQARHVVWHGYQQDAALTTSELPSLP